MDLDLGEVRKILDILDGLRRTWMLSIDGHIALTKEAIRTRPGPKEIIYRPKPIEDAVDDIKKLQAALAHEVQIEKNLTALQQYIRWIRQPGDEGPQND